MKSSFLSVCILCALVSSLAWGQSAKKQMPSSVGEKSNFDKFYERLSISYSGTLTTPTLGSINEGDWEHAAISTGYDANHHDTWPTNIWHQFSFSYNFGAKLSFFINPRLMTPLAHPVDMNAPEETSLIQLDDFLVGFSGVIYTSDDEKLNLWIRPAVRLPTSRASRATHPGAGYLNHQLDLSYQVSYAYSKQIEIGFFQQFRIWVYENQYSCVNRCRIVTAPYFYYRFNNATQLQLTYENFLETNRRHVPRGKRKEVFKDLWQNVMVGVNQKITSNLSVTPFTGLFVNDTPISDESVWFGAQLAYKIK